MPCPDPCDRKFLEYTLYGVPYSFMYSVTLVSTPFFSDEVNIVLWCKEKEKKFKTLTLETEI